nr:putative transmembrane protein (PGPGW) [uncultured bacterium]
MGILVWGITWSSVLMGALIFLVTFAINLLIVSVVLVKIPKTYFKKDHSQNFMADRSPALRAVAIVGKNLLGVLLVALGIVMSVPGVPGQGILTILLGIMLLDFPGRRQLEHKLVSRPTVFNAINKLRHRFGKPKLVCD